MFGGKFSHVKFSLKGARQADILIQDFFAERMEAKIIAGNNAQIDNMFREMMHAVSQLTLGIPIEEGYSDKTEVLVKVVGDYYSGMLQLSETLEQRASPGCDVLIKTDMGGTLAVWSAAGINIETTEVYTGLMSTASAAAINIAAYTENYREMIYASVSAEAPEIETTVITISMPAGSELRIDGENYTVKLNGENIIHLHDGVFVTLDRNAVSMLVSSGSEGEIEGKLIYTERYL